MGWAQYSAAASGRQAIHFYSAVIAQVDFDELDAMITPFANSKVGELLAKLQSCD